MEHGMKVQIECDSGAEELQVLIRCRELDDQVKEIQQALSTIGKCRQQFVFYKGDTFQSKICISPPKGIR